MPTRYRDRTPEARERAKLYGREYYHKRKTDPEYIAVRRDWYKKKVREDPGFWLGKYSRNPEHYREYARKVRARTPRIICGRPGSVRYEAKLTGFRSGFERTLDTQLRSSGVEYSYETMKIPYVLEGTYNPDFILGNGIIIEAKGYLDAVAKRKMIAVKKQHPELDIRFVFQSSATKVAGGKQTNADWARKNGFQFAEERIPEEWFDNQNPSL